MILSETLRGYVLEELLARLLRENGYALLVRASQDEAALREGAHGLLVRGRGSDHQADALGELLIPAPFPLPVRLFAEAKCKSEAVGLADVRNALGVLSDVNEFSASDAAGHDVPVRRYQYRYALFSTSGFTADAQRYALAHQLSLIDLQGPAFEGLRQLADYAAAEMLALAQAHGLASFPVTQMRTALREALGTWSAGQDAAAEQEADPGPLPVRGLAQVARSVARRIAGRLMLGFPQGPFILVLQPDDPAAFDAFLSQPAGRVPVEIRYAPDDTDNGEWVIMPEPRRRELAVRFGIPPILESWLLTGDELDTARFWIASQTVLSAITVFHHDGRLTQLRYQKMRRGPRPDYTTLAGPASPLRRELADPALAFRRRPQRAPQDHHPAGPAGPGEWTRGGIEALMQQLA